MNSTTPTTHPGKLTALQQCPLVAKTSDISKILTSDRGDFAGPCRGAPAATGAAQPSGELEENLYAIN